jgi:large subunit ribosomal protein L30
MAKVKILKLTLIRSISGRLPKHKATVASLGLRRMHQTIEIKDTPASRGMIEQVGYMLKVEEI